MSEDRRIIFCHIPKCGGTSIRKFLSVMPRGHVPLPKIMDMDLYRPGDVFFTVIRDPVKLAMSQVNYVTHMLVKGWDTPRDGWRAKLGECTGSSDEIARAVLHARGIVHENALCKFLGDGTPALAIDCVKASGIDVIDLPNLTAWLSAKWPDRKWPRLNTSPSYLDIAALSEADRRRLDAISQHDSALYDRLKRN